ncbi:MAG: DNA-binding protein [Halothiobacillaceae bacterium]
MAITNADIHAAADRIAAEGQTPTLASVRAALGGGSFTTISEGMKAWKAAQQTMPVPMREAAPQAVAERMAEVACEVWGIAQAMANERLASEREALEVTRRELEQAQAEAVELADALAVELDLARSTIEGMASKVTQLDEVNARQAAQLLAAQDVAHTSEAALVESRQRANELASLLHQEREALKEAREEAKRAATEAAEMRGKLSGMVGMRP